jgi:hypothetical protein
MTDLITLPFLPFFLSFRYNDIFVKKNIDITRERKKPRCTYINVRLLLFFFIDSSIFFICYFFFSFFSFMFQKIQTKETLVVALACKKALSRILLLLSLLSLSRSLSPLVLSSDCSFIARVDNNTSTYSRMLARRAKQRT